MLGRLTRLETILGELTTNLYYGEDNPNLSDNLKRLDEAKTVVKDMRADAALDVLRGFEVFGPIKPGEIHPAQYIFLAFTEYEIKKLMASAEAKYLPDIIRLAHRAIKQVTEAPELSNHLPRSFGEWLLTEYGGSSNPDIKKACEELQETLRNMLDSDTAV